ncbi:axoneme-associated protein mst101(2) [Drosophila bipectinata]|uniref:axoneme-associated protein mst101(2) n=1 Tax=Drosophila bipectinata TaxID=42026 RepID=UPI0038B2F861
MCSRLTGNVLTRFCGPSTQYVGLAVRPATVLVKYQPRHFSECSKEMSGAVFKKKLAESLRKKKAEQQKEEAQRDAIRMKDMLFSCIEQRTKVFRRSLESMSKEEQKAMDGLMSCVMMAIRSVCIRRVLLKFCKEQMMKRRCARLIKEKKIKCIMEQCEDEEQVSGEEQGQKEEKSPNKSLEIASLRDNKPENDCQVCEAAEEMKTYLKTAAKILENELNKDIQPHRKDSGKKCNSQENEKMTPEGTNESQEKEKLPKNCNDSSPPRSKYEDKLKSCLDNEWRDICKAQKYLSSKEKEQFARMADTILERLKKSCRKKVIQEMCEESWGVMEKRKNKHDQDKDQDNKKKKDCITKLWRENDPEAKLRQRVQDQWNEVCPFIKELAKQDDVNFEETSVEVKKMIRECCLKERWTGSQDEELKDVTKIIKRCALKAMKKNQKINKLKEHEIEEGASIIENAKSQALMNTCELKKLEEKVLQKESAEMKDNANLQMKVQETIKTKDKENHEFKIEDQRKEVKKKEQPEERVTEFSSTSSLSKDLTKGGSGFDFYKILRENYIKNTLKEKKREKIGLLVKCGKLILQEKREALFKLYNPKYSYPKVDAQIFIYNCKKLNKNSEEDDFPNKNLKIKPKKNEENQSKNSEKREQSQRGLTGSIFDLQKGSEDSLKKETKKDSQKSELYELREPSEEVALEDQAACGGNKFKIEALRELCKQYYKSKEDKEVAMRDNSNEKESKYEKNQETPKCAKEKKMQIVFMYNLRDPSKEVSLEEKLQEASCKNKAYAYATKNRSKRNLKGLKKG